VVILKTAAMLSNLSENGYNRFALVIEAGGLALVEEFGYRTLSDLALAHVSADPASLRFVPIGTGNHNSSYWVDSDLGRYVLRIAPDDGAGFLFYERRMMRQEPDLHALIRAETCLPVAKVVGHAFDRTRLDRDYVLMSALPGTPLSDLPGITQAQLGRAHHQVGEYLRELHALTAHAVLGIDAYGYLGAHRPMEPQATWAAAFSEMWNRLLDDVVACGCYTFDEAKYFRELLDRNMRHFDRPVVSSLLHMDVWSQNILVNGRGDVSGLVDFDRALWGDVEIEFAVLDYCGVSETAFWGGYGVGRDTSPAAMIRRQFYLLYEIQKYMPIRVWRGNDPLGAQRYKEQSFALAAQIAAV
jgi:fructosamine-3-kinase